MVVSADLALTPNLQTMTRNADKHWRVLWSEFTKLHVFFEFVHQC